MASQDASSLPHTGGCHCGAVRYRFGEPSSTTALECNCSVCAKKGAIHVIVPKDLFCLIQGEDFLTTYTFNTHTAKHLFCRVCGVQSYYVPRSNPDGVSLNLRCIDPGTLPSIQVVPFNGQEWEKQPSLHHLSAPASSSPPS
ncbi:glutathione-dependent formaldehyde-activating GFA [Piptocephalis cylindrospora]|uniref:Glutathione-dependent formaldehyde-activating GFA n=1 Tax=Piptocephalis cylindrospora TaxID=1907219 RepID=A0A4P9Y248_9FUNG|nr:glutathione-dependent formaldehyde-activating GFA [Piptocephalis cylindrospora]|eukprot:RKP12897.1 glutathione-dependent formaldehyde-activating GFA [Piptocephalis cylindrospora]